MAWSSVAWNRGTAKFSWVSKGGDLKMHHPACQLDISLSRGGNFLLFCTGEAMAGHWDQFGFQGISKAQRARGQPGRGGWQPGKVRRGCGSQAFTSREEEGAKEDPVASPAQRHLGDIWDGLCSVGHGCITGSPSQSQENNSYSYKFTVSPLPQETCLFPASAVL